MNSTELVNLIRNIDGVKTVQNVCIEPIDPDEVFLIIGFNPDAIPPLSTKEVALRNYNSAVKRDQIKPHTKTIDFIDKIKEELDELYLSWQNVLSCPKHLHFDPKELADISLVCDSMALHYGIDLEAEKEKKMLFNETRKDLPKINLK